jgi:hypothetical protein
MKTADLMEQRAAIVDRMNAAHEKDDNGAFEAAKPSSGRSRASWSASARSRRQSAANKAAC